jgi:predicted MFS family arabinose efflux permease
MNTASPAAPPHPWRRIFLPFAVGYFLSYLLRNANAVISPDLTRELDLSAADLGLLTAAYMFAFGAFQLPLGILLDRFGPRRVEAGLLLICAAGCALFATGTAMPQLTAGRALIGLGVSACLMASFKAFSLWFPIERQASLNAAIMASGGLGALAASSPLGVLLPLLGWRGIFLAIAALALLAAGMILTSPDKPAQKQPEPLRAQLAGLAAILTSRVFWRFAPQTTAIVGGFMAMQGLWAVPWLMHVDGLSREQAAFHLLLTAGAQLTGFLSIAFFVGRLARRGIPPMRLLSLGLGGSLLAVLGIVLDAAPGWLLWPALGLLYSVSNLAYALISAEFPLTLTGRVNTALNLGAFAGAFVIQWLFGVAVDGIQALGYAEPLAYRASLAGLLCLQTAAWLWFQWGGRPHSTRKSVLS